LVKEEEAAFTTKQEPVSIRVEAVIREATGQGVQRDAGGWGKERGEDVLGVGWEVGHGSKEDLGSVVVVNLA
jgi:hypothetical protein